MKVKEDRTRQEERQKLQQERDRFQGQLRNAQQEHTRTQGQLSQAQQERNQAREQLRQAQQDLRARENTLQELMDDLLTNLQRQTPEQRLSNEGTRQQIRAEEERRVQEQVQTQVERMRPAIRTEEHRRAQDQLWTRWQERRREELQVREQGLQEGLQGVQRLRGVLQDERKLRQELQLREQRLRGEMLEVDLEREGLPRERLREQLRQRIQDVLSERPSWEQLRHQLLNLHASVRSDYQDLEPQPDQLSAEFQEALEEQMRSHNRPEMELIEILRDLTRRGPRR